MGTDTAPPDVPIRVLLVDDDRDDFVLTRDLFAEIPDGRFRLDWVPTFEAGLEAVCGGTHDAYLVDYLLGARTGLELIEEALARGHRGAVLLLTGKGQRELALDALRLGAADYLEKAGLTESTLERAVLFAIRQHRYEAELERKVRERTEELARANHALREADRRKDEFLATMAHELRNPLAPIRNALEIMRLAPADAGIIARQREMLERQVGQLVRLIDDLLDVSRITTGKLRVQPEPLPLSEVIETALELSRPPIEKAKLNLVLDLPADPLPLTADRVRLAQVFTNLLNNAAKFTPEGGTITLAAERRGPEVLVRVRDTGVGISAEALPRVFELFTQIDRTVSRSQGGLGIGLALVRRLVELHGGAVAVHSDGPGLGTEVTVALPLRGANPDRGEG